MSRVREMYTDLTPNQLDFVVEFKYKNKTADEWLEEASKATGVDEAGNPNWYQYQSLAMDTITLAETIWDFRKDIEK